MKYFICGNMLDVEESSLLMRRIDSVMHGISKNNALRIATVNPDFLLRAWRSQHFYYTLAQADVHVIDGVGIALFARCSGRHLPRYAGADLLNDLLAMAQRHKWHVHVFCRRDGLSRYRDVARALTAQYPSLRYSGQDLAQDADIGAVTHLYDMPVIYLCAFGVPYQEYFLDMLRNTGARGVFIGIGGALDFITGKVQRAPRIMRRIGLEWLWRTWQQPRRVGKMIVSTIFFPVIALWCAMRRQR